MATINFYLDIRKFREKDGKKFPLTIVVSNKGTRACLPLPRKFSFPKEEWDSVCQRVTRANPVYRELNRELDDLRCDLEDRMALHFGLKPQCSASLIARKIADVRSTTDKLFIAVAEEYAGTMDKPKSKESYLYTISTIRGYDKLADELSFEDVDIEWIYAFRDYLTKVRGVKINTAAIHLENIRAVFNYARKRLKITTCYPFEDIEIDRQVVYKPILADINLRSFVQFKPYMRAQRKYHDIWLISFGLCGVNMADLYDAKKSQIVDGRFEYYRSKTGVFVSVKIEPEIMRLIERNKGKNGYLLDMREICPKNVDAYCACMNKSIKTWGPYHREGRRVVTDSHPYTSVTSYTARRQWASVAGDLDINEMVISMGLGHAKATMTQHYVQLNPHKLDEANRKVLIWAGLSDPKMTEEYCQGACLDDKFLKKIKLVVN